MKHGRDDLDLSNQFVSNQGESDATHLIWHEASQLVSDSLDEIAACLYRELWPFLLADLRRKQPDYLKTVLNWVLL